MKQMNTVIGSVRVLIRSVPLASLLLIGTAATSLADCSLRYTATVPLTDLGTGLYKRYQGGLYPGGGNRRPSSHETAGIAAAAQIHPLNAHGMRDDVNGKIAMMSVGMSNTRSEFDNGSFAPSFLVRIANGEVPNINPKLVIVNGALGKHTAGCHELTGVPQHCWTKFYDPAVGGDQDLWDFVNDNLSANGVTDAQVQVIWMKLANARPAYFGAFPAHAIVLRDDYVTILRNLNNKFPNLKMVYVSSRTRAYVSHDLQPNDNLLNPEPFAFEAGFATKWLVEGYINGVIPNVPYVTWGPYFWIDGLGADLAPGGIPGRDDGQEWKCVQDNNVQSDVRTDDYTHPGGGGITKVGNMLIRFFTTDPTATPWFLAGTPLPDTPENLRLYLPLQ